MQLSQETVCGLLWFCLVDARLSSRPALQRGAGQLRGGTRPCLLQDRISVPGIATMLIGMPRSIIGSLL